MALNPQQEQAANHHEGPVLVIACPGSGKTRTIEERTLRLINKGVPAWGILCITFTNKASNEMKERILRRVGDAAKEIQVFTFHKLCSRILRKSGGPLGYTKFMTILDDGDQIDLMSACARQMEHELTKPQIKKILWTLNDSRENLETQDQMFERFKAIDENYYYIAVEYVKRIREANSCDFSGLLTETVRLLQNHPEVLEKMHNRIKYLQVDEVQDTNYAQFKLIELIGAGSKNIFCVGDTDQSIYGWRGARMKNVTDFMSKYSATQIVLGKNYRSTPEIVAHADRLIKHNSGRLATDFSTDNPSGQPIMVKTFDNQDVEAKWIVTIVKQLISAGTYKPDEFAVFFRLNSMSRSIEMAMMAAGVPATVKGAFSFFDRREIKDIFAMLRFLVNPKDGVAFHRIANKPKRALGDVTVGKIENLAQANGTDIMQACREFSSKNEGVRSGIHEILTAFTIDHSSKTIPEVIDHLYKSLRYEEYLKEDDEQFDERKENVDELIKDAARFSLEHGNDISAYIESMSLMSTDDSNPDEHTVKLMSLHSSKGLEFPVVFMLGCEQDILPHKRAVDEREDGIEEERRLCYVGMTRAMKFLCMSHCNRRMDTYAAKGGKLTFKNVEPSQFFVEAGLMKPKPKKPVKKNFYNNDHDEVPPNW